MFEMLVLACNVIALIALLESDRQVRIAMRALDELAGEK